MKTTTMTTKPMHEPPPPRPSRCTIELELDTELHPAAALSRHQRFLYPKELSQALAHYGITGLGVRACRRLVREMKRDKLPVQKRTLARAVDAAAWLLSHPDWCPFPRHRGNSGVGVLRGGGQG